MKVYYIGDSKFDKPYISVTLYNSEIDRDMACLIRTKLKIDVQAALKDEQYALAQELIDNLRAIKTGLTAANNQTDNATTKDSMEEV